MAGPRKEGGLTAKGTFVNRNLIKLIYNLYYLCHNKRNKLKDVYGIE